MHVWRGVGAGKGELGTGLIEVYAFALNGEGDGVAGHKAALVAHPFHSEHRLALCISLRSSRYV
jgi:hypothetical protein